MRIAILTLPLRLNYGGILQTYALQTVLTRMGHDVKVVYNSPYRNERLFIQIYHALRHIVGKYLLHRYKGPVFETVAYNNYYRKTGVYIQFFIDKYIHTYLSINDMDINKASDFDAVVVGSDQVWRPCYAGKIERYFLDFARDWNIRKIAYAASFGVDDWELSEAQTIYCGQLIHLFRAVSVRENVGMSLCKRYFNVEPKWVLNPTMLLNTCDYDKLQINSIYGSRGMLFSYLLDKNDICLSLSKFISKKKNMECMSLLGDPNCDMSCSVRPSVGQWLSYFKNSSFVFTDSFHGCVFSIIYNKPFVVYSNAKRGESRLTSLLSLFNLQGRVVNSIGRVENVIDEPIDWISVNRIRKENIEYSMSFLKDALK